MLCLLRLLCCSDFTTTQKPQKQCMQKYSQQNTNNKLADLGSAQYQNIVFARRRVSTYDYESLYLLFHQHKSIWKRGNSFWTCLKFCRTETPVSTLEPKLSPSTYPKVSYLLQIDLSAAVDPQWWTTAIITTISIKKRSMEIPEHTPSSRNSSFPCKSSLRVTFLNFLLSCRVNFWMKCA